MTFLSNFCLNQTFSDPWEFEKIVPYWDFEQRQISAGRYFNRTLGFHTPRLQMSVVQLSVGMLERGSIEPGTTMIGMPVGLVGPIYYCGRALGEDEIPTLFSGAEYEIVTHDANNLLSVLVDCELLEQEARLQTGHSFSELVKGQRLLMSREEKKRRGLLLLRSLFGFLQRETELTAAAQLILEKEILEIIFSGLDDRSRKFRLNPSLRAARRARDYIHLNLRKEISITDICTAVGCNRRTLYHGFRERYGMSPLRYMTVLRLNEVRCRLSREPVYGRITKVAMDWGFFHLSRFTSQYSQLFQEKPSETVKLYSAQRPPAGDPDLPKSPQAVLLPAPNPAAFTPFSF